MKTLILMRHAKSDWSQPGLTDHDRPLNRRGQRAARLMGSYLNDSKIEVDLILASSAVRVQQTLELLTQTWIRLKAEVIVDHRLYLAGEGSIWNLLQETAANRDPVMVIGHNPGLGDLYSTLSREFSPFPTAAVAILAQGATAENPSQPNNHEWSVIDFQRPRDLED